MRLKFFVLATLVGGLLTLGFAQPKKQEDPPPRPDPYRLQVNGWAKDASIIREKKPVKEVKKGTYLSLADILTTKENVVTVFAGHVGVEEIQKNSKLRYVSIKPPKLDPKVNIELIREIESGEVYNRVSKLDGKSTYQQKIKGKIVSSKGTAFSVKRTGDTAEILVAEGEVNVQLEGATTGLSIGPRQKATVAQTLPSAPSPITEADELKIRALLSLPIRTLRGYSDPIELRREDAEDIVTLNVRNAFMLVRDPQSKVSKSRPNTIFVEGKALTWITAEGETVKFADAEFMGASRDGKVVVLFSAKDKLASYDEDGKLMAGLHDSKPSGFSLAPNGASTYWLGRRPDDKPEDSSVYVLCDPFTGYQRIVGPNFPPKSLEVEYRRGGSRTFLIGSWERGYFVVNPFPALLPFVSIETIQRTYLLEAPNKPKVSPGGDWLYAVERNTRYKLTRVNDGADFSLESKTEPRFIARSGLAQGVSEALIITGADDEVYAVDPSAPTVRLALTESDELQAAYQQSATSPNGELITFRNARTKTAFVADSQNLARDSDTYVGIGSKNRCEWTEPNEVWYEDELLGVPESIIITLGVKREGAVPGGPGTSSGAENGITELDLVGDFGVPINEFNVTSIEDDGTVTAIVKSLGFGAGLGSTRSGVMNIMELNGLPFARGKDGSIMVNGYASTGNQYRQVIAAKAERDRLERMTGKKDDNWRLPEGLYDYRPLLWRPGKGYLQFPNDKIDYGFTPPVMLDDGRVFLGGLLWNPNSKKDNFYLPADPPYGGDIEFESTRTEALLGVSRSGKKVFGRIGASGTYELWLGSLGTGGELAATTGARLVSSGLTPGGEDSWDNRPQLAFLSLGDDETIAWIERSTASATLFVKAKTRAVERYDLGRKSILDLVAVDQELAVGYRMKDGSFTNAEGAAGFVYWRGQIIDLDEILPEGYTFNQIRAVSRTGKISGSFFFEGKPRIAIIDLKKLLRDR
jgi:hypothetical protein